MSGDGDSPSAVCPNCGQTMRLVRSIPRLGALPEICMFSCPSCHEVEAKELKSGMAGLASRRGLSPDVVGSTGR